MKRIFKHKYFLSEGLEYKEKGVALTQLNQTNLVITFKFSLNICTTNTNYTYTIYKYVRM